LFIVQKIKAVKTALKAVRKVVVAAATGSKVFVGPEIAAKRVDTCHRCPHFKPKTRQCGLCLCFVDAKSKLATESCPDHRWTITNQG
jgi:hypothetical protein